MFDDTDLERAIDAGALSAEAAAGLRTFLAARAAAPANLVDEEQFRLITGFNDIFVSIACALVIFACALIGGMQRVWLGAGMVTLASWLMAEFFTRRWRMALPSIGLLAAFIAGAAVLAAALADMAIPKHYTLDRQGWTVYIRYPWQEALIDAAGAAAAVAAAWVHWRRFNVAITVAAGVAGLVALLLEPIGTAVNDKAVTAELLPPLALVCGIATFAFAMRWDLADPARRTIKADIAFWLHLLAAPLIAHPLFQWMGVSGGKVLGGSAVAGVLAIYGLFALVALAVDRRALLVSALVYVLVALTQLFRAYGAVELDLALTTLVIGSALLLLSAFWAPIRARVLAVLPPHLAARLPSAGANLRSA